MSADEAPQEDVMGTYAALAGEMVLDLIEVMGDAFGQPLVPPRRTQEYQDHLLDIALNLTRPAPGVMDDIIDLYEAHGWRGALDLMDLVTWHIGRLAPPVLRDAYDNVPLSRIIRSDFDQEATMLESAVELSASNQGLDFSEAMDLGEEVARSMQGWLPHIQNAVNAAAHKDRLGARAALSRGPKLRDPDHRAEVFRACTMLCVMHSATIDPRHVVALHSGF